MSVVAAPWRFTVDDYHRMAQCDGENMGFEGKERDANFVTCNAASMNSHARELSRFDKRFLSTDPMNGDPFFPQSWNKYAYTLDNPVNLLDPFGLDTYSCDDKGNCTETVVGTVPNLVPLEPPLFDEPGDGGSGSPSGGSGVPSKTQKKKAPWNPCSATEAVDFIHAHEADAGSVANELRVPAQNVLGLSGIESNWGRSNAAIYGNNFFGLHGSASAPFATGVWYTSGGIAMSAFPSYLASAKSFAAQYGSFVQGVSGAMAFAQALVRSGFNPATPPFGNPNFVPSTAAAINATAARMQCR